MKNLFTLVVGLLLAASFNSYAATRFNGPITNDGKYFLKARVEGDSCVYLAVMNDTLKVIPDDDFEALSKIERSKALWQISFNGPDAAGGYTYTFKNEFTGKDLSVIDTTGITPAHVEGGVSKFSWVTNPTSASPSASPLQSSLPSSASSRSIMIGRAFVAKKDLSISSSITYDNLLDKKENGEEVAMVGLDAWNPNYTYQPQTLEKGESHRARVEEAKQTVKNIDAVLKKYGLTRDSIIGKMAEYKAWAEAVEKISVPTGDKYEGETITASEALQKAFGEYVEDQNHKITYNVVGNDVNLIASDYGVLVQGMDKKWHGVVVCRTNNSGAELINGQTFAAGTVFINMANYGSHAILNFETAELGKVEFATAGDFKLTTSGIVFDYIQDAKNDPAYVNEFIGEFGEENQAKKDVAIQLDFAKDSDAPISGDNILEGKNLRFVVKNLMIASDGRTLSDAYSTSKVQPNDFYAVSMIQDTVSGKYLYVSDETLDETSGSTNYVLKWVKMKDVKERVEGAVTGVSYNVLVDEKDSVLPHMGSALFHTVYDPNDRSIVISPCFYGVKEEVYKTPYDNDDREFRLSLKKFGNSGVLTLVNTTSEKDYKIYVKDDNSESGVRYTKATTASDVYFIQYVSQLASNKADNGKYYTADGLKNLTDYEMNNHAENQWALYTDEDDSTVVILNRATADTLEINGTAINGQKLYKGIDLKADFDSYVTLRGGDTLKITSVDSLYKNDAEIGNYVYDKEFNKVSSYEFTYYNGLDNTKKLNVDKNGNLFVDPEGESIAFTLAAVDTTYGAPAIEGKSVELKKSIYAMSTVIKDTTYYVVEKNGKYAIVKNLASYTPVVFDIQTIQAADSTIYYAFVESDRSGKVSVDDETLELFKGDLTEPRTSMFAISSETYDIYRRLGTTIEDGMAAYDTAYAQFFKVDEPNRYLYENSSNAVAGKKADGINYLGVYNKKDMAKNASIFVDTAYVANNKIMPTYMLAVDAVADSASITGRYLVSLKDSAKTYNDQVRLGFVDAKHMGDSLIIARVSATAKDTIKIEAGKLNKASFAFELVDKVEKNAEADFYLKNADGYIQFVNGVPVLGEKSGAVVFNVEKTSVVPTANEEISAEGIKVIAGEGFVTIKGAEGKKVVVANILGQTIAGTVVSSNEAQIAAPAGVVVVSVEGEAAVKAIVK